MYICALLKKITGNLPHITTHPSNMTIILTNTSTMVQLKCEAEGASGYEWQTQSGKLLTGVTGQNTKVLTLYNLSMVDNDEYQCKATNDSGSSFSYFATLYVEGMYVCIYTYVYNHALRTCKTICVSAHCYARDSLSIP